MTQLISWMKLVYWEIPTFFLIDLEFMSKSAIITIFGYANEISLCHFHIVLGQPGVY